MYGGASVERAHLRHNLPVHLLGAVTTAMNEKMFTAQDVPLKEREKGH